MLHNREHQQGSLFGGSRGPRLALLAFAAGLMVVVVVATAFQLSYDRESILQRREAENDNLVRVFEGHLLRTLGAAGVTLKQLEADYRQQGERLELTQYIRDRQEELAPYSMVSVINGDGDRVTSNLPAAKPPNYRTVENYQVHSRDSSTDVFISKPRLGGITGKPTIYLSRRMNDADGGFAGFTVIGMDPQHFSRFYDQIDLGVGSVITLIGLDGVIRARRAGESFSDGEIGRDTSNTSLFHLHLKQAEHGHYRGASPVDGVRRLNSYRTVKSYPLVLLVGVSEDAALVPFKRQLQIDAGMGGVVVAVIIMFTAMLLRLMRREEKVTEGLRQSEERYALVTHATRVGIWDRNMQSGEDYLSPHGKEILGYRGDEPCAGGAAFFKRVHPHDAATVREAVAQSTRDGVPYRIEFRLRHRDGSYRWVSSSGQVLRDDKGDLIRMFGSIRDITDRKIAEAQIQEQARLLNLIFRHSLDSIVVLDKDYNFIRVSESYARAGQREASSFVGHNHFELYPSDFQQEHEPFRKEKKVYYRHARPFIYPDNPDWGPTYWDIGLVPILDSQGETELFLFTLKDVTERIRAEQNNAVYLSRIRALSRRATALQEQERRALARELHDEVGQMLTAIKIYLQTAQMRGEGDRRTFSTEAMHHALNTVEELLERVRSMSLNLRPMQLDDLGLAAALSALITRDAGAAGWIAHFDQNVSSKRFDASIELACYRVAQEALTNIMRHAGATEVWIMMRHSSDALRLKVRDNGCGIDLAAARLVPGMHMGLLGMEERVKDLGGEFEIVRRADETTELRASFPLGADVAAP